MRRPTSMCMSMCFVFCAYCLVLAPTRAAPCSNTRMTVGGVNYSSSPPGPDGHPRGQHPRGSSLLRSYPHDRASASCRTVGNGVTRAKLRTHRGIDLTFSRRTHCLIPVSVTAATALRIHAPTPQYRRSRPRRGVGTDSHTLIGAFAIDHDCAGL